MTAVSPGPTSSAVALDCVRVGFGAAAVPFEDGWQLQREVHAEVVAGLRGDTVLLLEHRPVYTAGKRTEAAERPSDGTPVVDVDRGGKLTWHGPGQIVGYPIVRLAAPIDVVAYVRRLEQVLIDVVRAFGVPATRVEGRSGAWVLDEGGGRDRKIAAIGIRVSRQVTMHGFSLNVHNDLGVYDRVVACGLPDADATSLAQECGRPILVADVLPVLEERLRREPLGGTGRRLL